MNFIRRLAVKGYTKELSNLINLLSQARDEQVSQFLIYGVWLRAIMSVEKLLPTYETESGEFDPELNSYPVTLREIESMIKQCKKNRLDSKVLALSIWVHTLRAIIRPEINELALKLWEILMRSPDNFDHLIISHKNEDIKLGNTVEFVNETELYAKAILKALPPKQLYRNNI